jgi:large subunit ribosomal protein L6
MSRIGNKAITIPAGVEVTVAAGNEVTVKGPKGTLTRQFSPLMDIKQENGILTVARANEEKHTKQLHGTTRALINNMIEGCHEGYLRVLEIVGIGFRAAVSGKKLTLNVGYSHPVEFIVEEGLTVECPSNTEIRVFGIDKQRVGEFAANIRATRKPEPYKGKGIRYKGEHVRRKEGKTAGKK